MMCSIRITVTPCSFRLDQQCQDVVYFLMRQAGHCFVGDQQSRRGGHGARQFQLAHFDLRQVSRELRGLVGEADHLEQLITPHVDGVSCE